MKFSSLLFHLQENDVFDYILSYDDKLRQLRSIWMGICIACLVLVKSLGSSKSGQNKGSALQRYGF